MVYFIAAGTDVQLSVEGGGTAGSIKRPQVALYSGNCGAIVQHACKTTTTNFIVLYANSLIKGNTYYLRVSTTDANQGTFKLCISNYTPTVKPGADCDGAVKLCDKSDVKVSGLEGGGKNKFEIEQSSCFGTDQPVTSTEKNSSWYKWTCEQSGTLTFDIIPINPLNDMDFLLYELAGNGTDPCGPRNILRCNASDCPNIPNGIIGLNSTSFDIDEVAGCPRPSTIDGYLKFVEMVAGRTYLLMISNFSTAEGFTVKFGGTGTFAGPKAVITASTAKEVCTGEKITYNGNLSTNYDALTWTFAPGIPGTATTIGPHVIDYMIPGTYMTYLQASDASCDSGNSIDSVEVTIYAPPILDTGNPVVSNTDCDKSTGAITGITVNGGKPAFHYEWYTPPATSVFTSTTSSDLNTMGPGSYYLIVTDANGCKDTTENFEIKKFDTPVTPGVLNNVPYCDGELPGPITADGTGGTYTWFDDADLKDTLHIGTVYTPVNTKTDTLYITETKHGCISDVDTVIVVINPLPVADAGQGMHILCSKEEVELKGSGSGGTSLSFNWMPSAHVVSGGNTLQPIVNAQGTYTLTVKNDSTGCIKTAETDVIKDPTPVAVFTPNVYTGEDPLSVNFINNSTGSNTYLWIFDGVSTSTDKNSSFVYVKPDEYDAILVASDNNKCPDTMRVRIIVYEKFRVEIPNVFTPNGDGINDVFTVNSTGITEISGEIYDRWGLKLYSWDQKNAGWDGHLLSGASAPDGTYYFILRLKRQDGKEPYIYSGQVTLLR